MVQRLVTPKVFGISQREFVDKRIHFYKSETKDLEDGEEDEIFMYQTSCPEDLYQINDQYERAETIIGLMKIGWLPTGGTYLHCYSQSDFKTSAWIQSMTLSMSED